MPVPCYLARADQGSAPACRIGLLALSTDHGVEADVHSVIPRNILAATTRVRSYVGQGAQDWLRELASASANIPQGGLDAILYACTSGSLEFEAAQIEMAIRAEHPESIVCNPVDSLKAAIAVLGIEQVAVLSPYEHDIEMRLLERIGSWGATVSASASFRLESDLEIAALSPGCVETAAIELLDFAPSSDAVFIACNGLRALRAIKAIELRSGKIVLTSSQVMIWHALQQLGKTALMDLGAIFTRFSCQQQC